MVLDQETDFVFFLRVELKSQRGGIQRLEAPDHMIRVRHAFSDVMEKQRKHEEFAAFKRLPKIGEMRRTLILWLTEVLQLLDRAQRMLVHRVAVIKIAHDERIDGAKFREHLGQQSQPVHRPQRNRRIARREQFPELWPERRCLWSCFPRPLPDLSHGVFGFAAERHAGSRGLAQQGEDVLPGLKRVFHSHFKPARSFAETLPATRRPCRPRFAPEGWPVSMQLQPVEQLAIQCACVAEIRAHPLRRVTRGTYRHTQRTLRRVRLSLVRMGICDSSIRIVYKPAYAD